MEKHRSLKDFAATLPNPEELNKSEFMEFCSKNSDILHPVIRWRKNIMMHCGGRGFWEEQADTRYNRVRNRWSDKVLILRNLFNTNHILLSSLCYTIMKSRPFFAIRFCFIVLAYLFIIFQTSDVRRSEMRYGEIMIDLYFILEGLLRVIGIKVAMHIQVSLGNSRKSVYLSTFRSSAFLSGVASILSLSFNYSAIGDWAKLFRLSCLTSSALRRMEHIDVLMVRSKLHIYPLPNLL